MLRSKNILLAFGKVAVGDGCWYARVCIGIWFTIFFCCVDIFSRNNKMRERQYDKKKSGRINPIFHMRHSSIPCLFQNHTFERKKKSFESFRHLRVHTERWKCIFLRLSTRINFQLKCVQETMQIARRVRAHSNKKKTDTQRAYSFIRSILIYKKYINTSSWRAIMRRKLCGWRDPTNGTTSFFCCCCKHYCGKCSVCTLYMYVCICLAYSYKWQIFTRQPTNSVCDPKREWKIGARMCITNWSYTDRIRYAVSHIDIASAAHEKTAIIIIMRNMLPFACAGGFYVRYPSLGAAHGKEYTRARVIH